MNNDYYWLTDDSRKFLAKGYLKENETPEQRYRCIAETAERILGIKGFADEFEQYNKQGFYSISSPIISNFGNDRGLPVSCFNSYIPDTMEGILDKMAEVGIMTKMGGGTSGYFGHLRHRGTPISVGGTSSGPVHFMSLYDTVSNVVSQSNVRRGSFAAYLDVDHPDFMDFLKIRSEGHAIQGISLGACISDAWMESMIAGDKEKRKVWAAIISKRFESGYPYLSFTDAMNRNKPECYKKHNLKIYSQQLCNEVCLPSSLIQSYVCVLASLNLVRWEEIKKNPRIIKVLSYLLDAVTEEFIMKTENMRHMQAARDFAINHRAVGLGVLGWHSFLQSKMIAFESMEAKLLTSEIFRTINEQTLEASKEMAVKYGEPFYLKGFSERQTCRIAVAPTTSSAFILGQVSPSIEPLESNYFVRATAKGKFSFKNPYLKEVFRKYGKDVDEVWDKILLKGGSVQHLDFLTDHEKKCFKTFAEISQYDIVVQNSIRQKFVDQGISLNLMISQNTPPKEVSNLYIEAWKLGMKGMYYQRGVNATQELARSILNCVSCEA